MSHQYPLPLPHSEAMDADDFMVTSSNEEAAAWIGQWPEWPSHCLVIYGPPGSGKTHLAGVWRVQSGAKALGTDDLAAGTRSSGMHIVIDDADKVVGNTLEEEFLFHLYNRLQEAKGFLLLTSTQAPAQWGIQLADLRSRLSAAPAVAIAAPDDELLSALLIKQFRDRQIDLSMGVIDYLLPRVERTPAAIRHLVSKLDNASLAEGRRISIAMARKFLPEIA